MRPQPLSKPAARLQAFLLAGSLFFAALPGLGAEQLFRFDEGMSYPAVQVVQVEELPSGCQVATLSLAQTAATAARFSRFESRDSTHRLFSRSMLRLSTRPRFHGRPLLSLMDRPLASRYGAWATADAGYGDPLFEDRVGRARMNGAGIQDPDVLYVKLTIRF